ncbi:MAG: PAS domain S-box protein [Bacteroidetes bacterium 4572_77]|nr:MAG: PAS domain S-box protein [Bacteroidetes bacterium 4572_77]
MLVEKYKDAIDNVTPYDMLALEDKQMQMGITPKAIHYVKKENILFPFLEKKWESYRPLNVMWSLHDDIRKMLKSIISMLESTDIKWQDFNKDLGKYFFLVSGMIQKEDMIIFPVATETVTDDEWMEMYNQSFEYSFPFIEKPTKKEKLKEKQQTAKSSGEQNLGFQTETGNLNFEQVLLAFNHLPVDITFVDENDNVRYFSRAKERFFPRSPAIVGRNVKNCHPPESVHIVEKIVEEFKSGNKDVADFRIKMKGKYILIRYFAMRNDAGEYKGILEVGEDITEISEMNDEKRLLDWK